MNHILHLLLVFTLGCSTMQGQEPEMLFDAPDNWISERLTFPLSFAPEIPLTGFEDLKFAPTWSDPNSPEFWTYTFVWAVDQTEPLTAARLSQYLESYYDGLMRVDEIRPGDIQRQKTKCTLSKTNDSILGNIQVFDHFFTKKMMEFHIKISDHHCAQKDKYYIIFQVSSKPFTHDTWTLFNKITFNSPCTPNEINKK